MGSVPLTITTGLRAVAPPTVKVGPGPLGGVSYFVVLTGLVLFILLGVLGGLRRMPAKIALGFAVLLLLISAGCNSGNMSGAPAGTPAGNYQITVTGTSGAIRHTTVLNLQVN